MHTRSDKWQLLQLLGAVPLVAGLLTFFTDAPSAAMIGTIGVITGLGICTSGWTLSRCFR